jgi:hypothetical protein
VKIATFERYDAYDHDTMETVARSTPNSCERWVGAQIRSVFRQLRQVSTHCSLSDLCNWDVPGGTNCSHLKDHFAVLGPCIMRSSRGFGI